MEKINKKELNKIIMTIGRQVYIGEGTPKFEKFKQIKINNYYIPYIITSFGRIFSLNYKQKLNNIKELKTTINDDGYKCIIIRYHRNVFNLKIHRLVALAFIKNNKLKTKNLVNHIDGIKTNNYEWNLEWCTPRENVIHAEKHHLARHLTGIDHPCCKSTEDDIHKVCKLLSTTNKSIDEISEITNVSTSVIRDIKRGKTWKNISANYDFSNYNFGHIDITDKVHMICKYAETNKYTMKEISKLTGVPYPIVKNIVKGINYKNISCNYNISNFNNYETHKHKKVKFND